MAKATTQSRLIRRPMEKLLLRLGACSGVLMGLDLGRQAPAADEAEDLGRRAGDVGAGAVDGGDAGLLQELVVLGRDDSTADDQHVPRARRGQGLDELG